MIIPLVRGALPLGEIADILHTEIPPSCRHATPSRLVTDSREIQHGDLFCALIGNHDGHRYTEEAAERGAVAILAEQKTNAQAPHILVPSVRLALSDWAIAVSKGKEPLRIGITGSVGKTTVKDALAAMLSVRFSVHATYGNYNNDLGLPFTILSAPHDCQMLVCELGINHPQEMSLLSRTLRPHISLITCIGHAHIGAFGNREEIAAEKREILRYAEAKGRVYVPITEPLLFMLPPRGIRREGIAPFDAYTCKKYGLSFSEEDIPRNLAYAFSSAVGKACGLSEKEITEGLLRISALNTHRKEYPINEIRIIEDCYNASPESTMAALCLLSKKQNGRRVAVLGDMLELGERSDAFHHAIGRFAAKHADLLFFFGRFAQAYADGAKAGGAHPLEAQGTPPPHYFVLPDSKQEAATQITIRLIPNDCILFKASRALKTEELIDGIKDALL